MLKSVCSLPISSRGVIYWHCIGNVSTSYDINHQRFINTIIETVRTEADNIFCDQPYHLSYSKKICNTPCSKYHWCLKDTFYKYWLMFRWTWSVIEQWTSYWPMWSGGQYDIVLINTPCLPKHKSIIVLLYNKCMLCISCHFGPLKPLTLRMDHAKLHVLDILTSLPVSLAILPRAVCFAKLQPANHATWSYISARQTMRHAVYQRTANHETCSYISGSG